MGSLWIFILVGVVLVPLIRAAKQVPRTTDIPPVPLDNEPYGWGGEEEELLESERNEALQLIEGADTQEGVRTTPAEALATTTDMVVERKAVGPKFDLRAAVVADAVLHAQYKEQGSL